MSSYERGTDVSRVNTNPPPRPPSRWPLYLLIAILVVLVIGFLVADIVRRSATGPRAQATATPVGATATAAASGVATATPASGPTPTASALQPPTNPTSMRVVPGSCTAHRIEWTWSGAQRATSYEVVVYDPATNAAVRNAITSTAAYTLPAGPGAAVALKVRSRNAAGTGPGYFTPDKVGRVPLQATNPTHMTAATSGHTISWTWMGATHATAYELVLYHYHGGTAKADITARTVRPHWSTPVTPGIAYYLKVRSVGECAPSSYFTPSASAIVGATPMPSS